MYGLGNDSEGGGEVMIGAIMMGLGAGLGAYGKIQGGRNERRIAEYNAQLMEQRAVASEQAQDIEREMMTDRARKLKAEQTAGMAKSGAMLSSGTPLMVLAEQSADMQRDITQQQRNRMIEQQQLRSQGEMLKYQGKLASRAGLIGGAASILGGAGQIGMSGAFSGGGTPQATGSYGGGFSATDYSNSKYMSRR